MIINNNDKFLFRKKTKIKVKESKVWLLVFVKLNK